MQNHKRWGDSGTGVVTRSAVKFLKWPGFQLFLCSLGVALEYEQQGREKLLSTF